MSDDIYDREIAFLTAHPEQIERHWGDASPLFQFCTPDGMAGRSIDGERYGCLTMVKCASPHVAYTSELTTAIRADSRIPLLGEYDDLTVEKLPIMAEWQRKIDVILNRTPPTTFPGDE